MAVVVVVTRVTRYREHTFDILPNAIRGSDGNNADRHLHLPRDYAEEAEFPRHSSTRHGDDRPRLGLLGSRTRILADCC